MRTKKALIAVASLAAIGLGLAGCQAADSTGGSSAGQDAKLLGIVSIASGIDLNDNATQGAKDAAEAAGWNVEVVDAGGDPSKANAAITNFVNKGADAIFTHVFPAVALGSGLAAAEKAGVPVASWGGGPAPASSWTPSLHSASRAASPSSRRWMERERCWPSLIRAVSCASTARRRSTRFSRTTPTSR